MAFNGSKWVNTLNFETDFVEDKIIQSYCCIPSLEPEFSSCMRFPGRTLPGRQTEGEAQIAALPS